MSQKLRGFVGQSMAGQKKALTPVVKFYTPGTYTLTVLKSGVYRFVLWGPGGRGGATPLGGGGGGFILADRYLAAQQRVGIVTGLSNGSAAGTDTVVTLPSGEVMTAGAGKEFNDGTTPGGGGVATTSSGLDTKTAGTAGAAGVGGVGASTTDFLAGASSASTGGTPAAGAGPSAGTKPGDGLVIIHQIRMGR